MARINRHIYQIKCSHVKLLFSIKKTVIMKSEGFQVHKTIK